MWLAKPISHSVYILIVGEAKSWHVEILFLAVSHQEFQWRISHLNKAGYIGQ
jgi:hypothetical protein